jgi:hypothetical protein
MDEDEEEEEYVDEIMKDEVQPPFPVCTNWIGDNVATVLAAWCGLMGTSVAVVRAIAPSTTCLL